MVGDPEHMQNARERPQSGERAVRKGDPREGVGTGDLLG